MLEVKFKAHFAPGVSGLMAPLQDFLDDKNVSEILINRPGEVFVERKDKMLRFDLPILTSQYLKRLFMLIANENRQSLSEDSPILSGNLADGSRVQLVIPEASTHETLSIRKFVLQDVSFEKFSSDGFFNCNYISKADEDTKKLQELYKAKNWQEFLKYAILKHKNIVISGATSSGKTTFLNSCIQEIPLDERIITLEDTIELKLKHQNCVRLKAIKSINDKECISMQILLQASLRLRPDRIIMGEIRGRELFDFIAACSTGHSGLATIHANNPKIAFMRMAQLYKLNNVVSMSEEDIYKALHAVVDIVVQLEKTETGRRLTEVYYKDAL